VVGAGSGPDDAEVPVGSHRAPVTPSEAARRLVPPLAAVTAVVVVIVLLLVLNRSGHNDSTGSALGGPAVVTSPSATASRSPTVSPSPTPSPSQSRIRHPAPVTEPSATATPRLVKVPVTVLNNSRVAHLAARAAAQLRSGGWPIRQVGNFTGRIAYSTAYYPPGEAKAAESLARQFPAVRRVLPRFHGLPGHGLTLVVTRDWPH
jgi:hypothetical protein